MKNSTAHRNYPPLLRTCLALLLAGSVPAMPAWSAEPAAPAANATQGAAESAQPQHRRRSVMEMRTMVKNLRSGLAYQQANAKAEGVVTLPSGLQYHVIKEGHGAKAKRKDTVDVLYQGSLTDGKVFVRTLSRSKPAALKVSDQIPGLQEALQLMPAGSKWNLSVPAHLAYGAAGAPPDIGSEATLLYDIEVVAVQPRTR